MNVYFVLCFVILVHSSPFLAVQGFFRVYLLRKYFFTVPHLYLCATAQRWLWKQVFSKTYIATDFYDCVSFYITGGWNREENMWFVTTLYLQEKRILANPFLFFNWTLDYFSFLSSSEFTLPVFKKKSFLNVSPAWACIYVTFFEQTKAAHLHILLAFNTSAVSWVFAPVTAIFKWCF